MITIDALRASSVVDDPQGSQGNNKTAPIVIMQQK